MNIKGYGNCPKNLHFRKRTKQGCVGGKEDKIQLKW